MSEGPPYADQNTTKMRTEEQAEEIEILESIYPDELEIVDDESIAVHLKLETEQPRNLKVTVTYVEEYPDAVPKSLIETEKPEDDDNDEKETEDVERKYSYEFTSTDCADLVSAAKEVAEENIGIPMVFTIVSAIKEQAEELYENRIKEQEAERLKQSSIEEEKEQAKFRGTPVTKQSFAEWRKNFRAEMGLDKPKERPFGRLTGRELFERGLLEEESDEEDESK